MNRFFPGGTSGDSEAAIVVLLLVWCCGAEVAGALEMSSRFMYAGQVQAANNTRHLNSHRYTVHADIS